MSASEKLKALADGYYERVAAVSTDYADVWLATTLRQAMPQIVAVVEAAEAEAGWTGTENYSGPRLRPALVALYEALS